MAATKNPIVRLRHIQDEINGIVAALATSDRDTFRKSYVLLRAAERALLIISEAAKSLPEDLLKTYPEVDWIAVRALGNVLRHEYHAVDPDTLWEILHGKLPELGRVVTRMIGESPG